MKPQSQSKRARWRRKRMGETPPPGHKTCVNCLVFKPIEHFQYNYGERVVCFHCYQMKQQYRKQRTEWRREVWRSDPKHRAQVKERHDKFKVKKPWMMRFYKWRQYVDDVLNHGPEWARKTLEDHGVVYDMACRICGATDDLHAYWPDYSRPTVIYRYCPHHRKIEAFADARTLSEQADEAEKGLETIAEIRGHLTKEGLGYGALQQSIDGTRGK